MVKEADPTPSFGDIDELLAKVDNKYLLVNAARVRAQQLVNRADAMIEGTDPEKAVSSAFSEIRAGKLNIEIGQPRPRK
ncbi:MAG: DNA-directed RNA polymerase subunit omega [Candidatus Eremiobacteraeota bacterium]|nr:DNA-directed RNA polymerase subunit omega [Candidatus Eremiobacteraeota bacterium]